MPVSDECRLEQLRHGHGCEVKAVAKNCTSLTMIYLDRCGKVTGAGIEALAQSCPSVNNVDLDRCDKVTP